MIHLTRSQIDKLNKERVEELVKFAGGKTHLARMLGVTLQCVCAWFKRGKISKKAANLVEKNSALNKKFNAEYLRSDLTSND